MTQEIKNQEFVNNRLGYRIELPAGWEEIPNEDIPAFYVGPVEQNYLPNLGVNSWTIAEPTPDGYKQAAESATAAAAPTSLYTTLSEITVGGVPALVHTYAWKDDETNDTAVQQQLFIQNDTILLCFIFSVNQALAQKYLPLFAQAIASVRLIKSTDEPWVNQVNYQN